MRNRTYYKKIKKENQKLKQKLENLQKQEENLREKLEKIRSEKIFQLKNKINPFIKINFLKPLEFIYKIIEFKKILKSKLFNSNWYFNQYSDVLETAKNTIWWKFRDNSILPLKLIARFFTNPVFHYIESGAYEDRDPNPFFSSFLYLKNNTYVRKNNINPLFHYITQRKTESRRFPYSKLFVEYKQLINNLKIKTILLQDIQKELSKYEINKINSKKPKIAVHLHLYFLDLMNYFIKYLKNISYPFDLYISIPENKEKKIIKKTFKNNLPTVEKVIVENVKNQGRNFAPLIITFGKKLLNYDILLHIHSKKSKHNKEYKNWLDQIITTICGNKNIVNNILNILLNNGVIIYPEPFNKVVQDPQIWGPNKESAKKIIKKLKLNISIDDLNIVEFPTGGMFWIKPKYIKKLLTAKLKYSNFPKEPLPLDGSIIHGLERLILFICKEKANNKYCYKIIKNKDSEIENLFGSKFNEKIIESSKTKIKNNLEREKIDLKEKIYEEKLKINSINLVIKSLSNSKIFKLWQKIKPLKLIVKELIAKTPNINLFFFKKEWNSNNYSIYLKERFENSYKKSSTFVPYTENEKNNWKINDIKLIAFYLPQYHPFPENEKFWGKGFTEWINVTKAQPLFINHYQPRLPSELGFYDLRIKDILKEQIKIAKNYGIYGFCFHTYYFDGKLVMYLPLKTFLENKDLDINFCIHWANEPWTVRWDGFEKSGVLLPQKHNKETDVKFIEYIAPALKDKRYIRINGKPLLIIYRPSLFPNIKETIRLWNRYCLKNKIGKLFLATMQTSFEGRVDPRKYGFDAAIDYPPHNLGVSDIKKKYNLFYPNFEGHIFDYKEAIEKSLALEKPNYLLFRGIVPDWDCTPRRINPDIFVGSNPKLYQNWLMGLIDYTKKNLPKGKRFVFINAWNEWAEGAYLEPDKKWGYGYLKSTYEALLGNNKEKKIIFVGHDGYKHGAQFLALNLLKYLKINFKYNIKMLLKEGGPLVSEYKKYAEVTNLQSFTNEQINTLIKSLWFDNYRIAITNTVVTGDIVKILKENNIKVISLIHEMPQIIHEKKMEDNAKLLTKNADFIIFPSLYVFNKFKNNICKVNKNYLIHPQGLYKRNRFKENIEKAKQLIRKKLNLTPEAKIVLGVGYGDKRKGFDSFIKTGKLTITKNSNVYFLWVGNVTSENKIIYEKLPKYFKKNIKVVEFQEDTDLFYAGSDLYFLSSREDPFPSVVLEAFDVGLPVVAFKDSTGAEGIINNNAGALVESYNLNEAVEKILKLLNNKNKLLRIKNYAQKLIEKKFRFTDYVFFLLDKLNHRWKKVSVIIPNFNYGKYLLKRIQSIINQSYPIYEIIYLDDQSTDNSLKIANKFLQNYPVNLKILVNSPRMGTTYKQWVKGLSLATGEIIWIAESDDYCDANFLEKAISPMETDKKIVLSYTQSTPIDENSNVIAPDYLHWINDIDEEKWKSNYVNKGTDEIKKCLCIKNTIPNASAVIFKKNCVKKNVLNKLINFKIAGDWYLYTEILKQGKVSFIAESLNFHRRHNKSITSILNNKIHYNEICDMQNSLIKKYKLNGEIIQKILNYRKIAKKNLNINNNEKI